MKTNLALRGASLAALCAAMSMQAVPAMAEISGETIRIGVMNDQSGAYSDNCGSGSTAAVRLAAEDFNNEINGADIEVVVADDQNKPDIGVATARRWIESEGVDAIVGCSASSIALAVQEIMREAQKPYLIAGTATSDLTNSACSPYTTQWLHDTYSLPKATIQKLLEQGQDTFYFITVDYTFGKQWQEDATRFIENGGGQVLGSVLHPLNTTDFSSQLLQAQASGAKVIALANSGSDFANVIKQASEFGIRESGQTLAPLGAMVNQIHGIGLDVSQGMILSSAMYWDLNDETRAFAERFREATNGRTPNEAQMATYTAVRHYLSAVQETGSDAGEPVVQQMKAAPVQDFAHKDITIREDGQVMHPMLAVQVKDPAESEYTYDYYEVLGEIPAEDSWRPASESECSLISG
ncbi:MAG: ABC transporter substrate-binding protein [Alphaproteobacteria bacterium]|nr:ABC transporter substrate-binding protein [Alphaproteobacteria bacterium]